jgi:hypothetical protein
MRRAKSTAARFDPSPNVLMTLSSKSWSMTMLVRTIRAILQGYTDIHIDV